MSPFVVRYLVGWLAYCAVALLLAIRGARPRAAETLTFLREPWKVLIFLPGIVFVTFAGHFTDDETWDVVSGGGMSVLTVLTAWWSVGTAARVVRKLAPPSHLVVALALTLFSSSWFYDGYLLLRDGAYTQRWIGNLMLSPTIYICAGLIANLELRGGKLALAFTRSDWPKPVRNTATWPLLVASIPLVALATYFLVGFVGWHFGTR
jgi:hypothetical protein